MPALKVIKQDLEALVGLQMTVEEARKTIESLAGEVEGVSGDEITVKFEPIRPDLFSVEGIARAMRGLLEIETGIKHYKVKKGSHELIVEKSVEPVRPVIVGAFVHDVKFDDYMVRSIMDFQEKIHATLGRNRKKVSIGVHDSARIHPPFKYKAVDPESVTFVPLGMGRELDMAEILRKHEKGLEFAWILEGKKAYPLLVDKDENVLSFPPIINGELTKVSESTTDLFIDVTGLDRSACSNALTILCCALVDRGATLESIEVSQGGNRSSTPSMQGERMNVQVSYARRLLDPGLKPEDCVHALKKLRFGAEYDKKKDSLDLEVPAYRSDILHPADVVEDIAIGLGYDSFAPILPKAGVLASSGSYSMTTRAMVSSLIGLGFIEIVTLILTDEVSSVSKARTDGERVPLLNPFTSEQTHLRSSLLPSVLQVISLNRRRDMPIKLFEVGRCVIPSKGKPNEASHLCGALMHPKAGFTECKSIVEALLRDLGLKMEVKGRDHPTFVPGRCASLWVDGNEIGLFGEVHPDVLVAFELPSPAAAFEIDVQALSK
jgi:phenylalanyl-tRNA synthetase beta chain